MNSPLILSQQSINIIVVTVAIITATYYLALFFYCLTQKFKQRGTTKKIFFLRIYILMTMLFTVLLWKIMKTNSGTLQREIVLAIFMITASLAIIAVLWRAQIVRKTHNCSQYIKKIS